ncbi:MAG: Rne/Rng family ribonuclease [Bacteroidia bacterium]|nr:Rne/Rng family ribonuclease [Bacteroidia bacterium]
MRELVLTRENNTLHAYLLEGRSLVEYHELRATSPYALGDIFLGEVTQVVRGLNAAFVELGLAREGFLHYTDTGPDLLVQKAFIPRWVAGDDAVISLPPVSSLPKEGNIADYVRPGDWLLVQVVKEMSDNKGPRLTTGIGLTGHNIVMLPFSSDVGVSHRVTDPILRQTWRDRLRQLYRPPYGLILRTSGASASLEEVASEYERLIQRWELFLGELKRARPPHRFRTEDDLHHVLSDLFSPTLDTIHVSEESLYKRIERYFAEHPLTHPPAIRLHRRYEQLRNVFDPEYAKRTLLGRTVTLPNGAYLVIEHTEALHVIDVNTGSLSAKEASVEEVIFQTNLLAAHEIARQLRLRDLGGIIIVDFIDMKSPEHRQRVQERLRESMRSDRAKHSILPMSEIGLVQITRQRRRQPVEIPEAFPCPFCQGTGKHTYPPELLLRIQKAFSTWANRYSRVPLRLRVHPLWMDHWRQIYPNKGNWLWDLIPNRWVWVEADPFLSISGAELISFFGERIAVLE